MVLMCWKVGNFVRMCVVKSGVVVSRFCWCCWIGLGGGWLIVSRLILIVMVVLLWIVLWVG